MAAAPRDNDAADDRATANAFLAVALVGAMLLLKLSAPAIQIHII